MTTEKKIAAINNYNEFVGSCIRYEENGGNFYRIDDDGYDEVSEKHIKEAYEEALENLDRLYESFLGIEK